jgi:hypothetical protein
MVVGDTAHVAALVLVVGILSSPAPAAADDCAPEYDGTFALIEKVIFEKRGCTSAICHGEAREGDLDLRPGAAYAALIDRPATSVEGWERVVPGQKDQSLLWINLAAKTLAGEFTAPRRAMPADPFPAIEDDELEALRLWIEQGAPEEGVVAGTAELLKTCLPPARPIQIAPLPPPPPGVGVQLHMPPWVLAAQSEAEVCFASYYDVSAQVGPEFRDPSGRMMRVKGSRIRQDPLSHHLVSFLYDGSAPPDDPAWGEYSCVGGPRRGEPCNPADLGACGDGGECATAPVSSVACIGFGPADSSVGFDSFGITGIQETASETIFTEGVYFEMPVRGTVIWNSHAFNVTDEAGKLEAWLNFYLAPPEEQRHEITRIFAAGEILNVRVPAFETDESCAHYEMPANARLFELSSHMHKRGKRFRIFRGRFACAGGPHDGRACSPYGADFASPDRCAGMPCRSVEIGRAGDCNRDGEVAVGELIAGIGVALGRRPMRDCPLLDVDRDESAGIDDLLAAVDAAMHGTAREIERDADESLLYDSRLYNDPLLLEIDPPLVFPGAGSSRDERSLTYCGLYDNGFTSTAEVKRRSTSPASPDPRFPLGGPCGLPTHCTEGLEREPCSGDGDAERDASCDSSPGAGDGFCDACPLTGGVTTEDEMFLLIGSFYVP